MTYRFEHALGVQQGRTIKGELRAMGGGGIGAGDEFALVGYAAKYNSWSKDFGGFKERIMPGAFARSVRDGDDVKALFNHHPDNILGRTKSGTLTLQDTVDGLRFRIVLNRDSQAHRDLYEAVKRGDIDECSFAFTVPPGGDDWMDGADPEDNSRKIALRTLKNVDLLDISVVTYPAYGSTNVSARQYGYSKKTPFKSWQADLDQRAADLQFAIATLRKAAQSAARCLVAAHRESPTLNLHEAISGHLRLAHEFQEAAFSMSETAQDLLAESNPDLGGEDYDENSLRGLRKTHEFAHESARQASQHFAKTRMAHSKMKRKK